jgi:hypothetical protein
MQQAARPRTGTVPPPVPVPVPARPRRNAGRAFGQVLVVLLLLALAAAAVYAVIAASQKTWPFEDNKPTRTTVASVGAGSQVGSSAWRASVSSVSSQPISALQIAPPNMIATGTTSTIATTMITTPSTPGAY